MSDPVRMISSVENDVAALHQMFANVRRFLKSFKPSRERNHALSRLEESESWAEKAIRG